MNANKRMQVAADLIREGDYERARSLLETVDSPKAREWISKIDALSEKPKRTRKRSPLVKLIFFVLFSCVIVFGTAFLLSLTLVRPNVNGTRNQNVPSLPNSAEAQENGQVTSNETLRGGLQRVLNEYGEITDFESQANQRNADGRLITFMNLRLEERQNRQTALNAIEQALRQYAQYTTAHNNAGQFVIRVEWTRNGFTCADNAGMGYRTMQAVNWNGSQRDIFRAIDKNLYGDSMDNAYYGDVGFAPDRSDIESCNQ